MIEGRKVDGPQRRDRRSRRGHLLAHRSGVSGELGQARGDQARGDVEDLGRLGDELRLGKVAVAVVVGGLGQRVGQAGLDALGAVARDADRGGDRVGGLESDAPDVGREAVRVLLDGLD
jgi:hypothetical protein